MLLGLSKNLCLKTKIGPIKDILREASVFFNIIEKKYLMLLEKKEAFNALLKDIKHAKGKRLIFNLPLNGQRTKTNAKTIRRLSKNTK